MMKTMNLEACCLTTKSFTKTPDSVLSSVKIRVSTSHKKLSHLNYNSGAPRGCVTYCSLGSSSAEDDSTPIINTDWRSFRARLIADELTTRTDEPSNWVDPDVVEELPPKPHISVDDKWAHRLHEPEKGCLLIATEKLDGVHIFERTVILVLSAGPIGPTGIILNRPSLMSIKEIGSKALDDAVDTFSDCPLFFGGPLEEGLFMLSPKEGDEGVRKSGVLEEVMKGLYYGTKESVGCAAEMVKRDVVGVEDFKFFDGYCGWEKDQLKEEIKSGYWTVAACSPSVIGLASIGRVGLWEEILGLMGQRKVL